MKISYGKTSVQVQNKGAEMNSFYIDGVGELMWQGDPAYWPSYSPILFPVVGAVRDNKVMINGEWFDMNKHGFVRPENFELCHSSDTMLEYLYSSNDMTKKSYPFDFDFKVKFEVSESSVKVTYTVKNTGDKEMPFFVGGHPGFNVPFPGEDDAVLTDYEIEFAENETASSPVCDMVKNIIDYSQSQHPLNNEKTIPLTLEFFKNDAVIYENLSKNVISLKSKKSGAKITMDYSEFTMIGIWKQYNESKFVCLEPWVGCGTTNEEGDDITDKKYCQFVAPDESKSYSYTVTYSV